MALPGARRKILGPNNTPCEKPGCSNCATVSLCTESDSFGDEWTDLCDEHLPDPNAKDVGDCDHCEAQDVELTPTRDPEEIHGPVSYVCPTCLSRHREYVNSLMAELDDYDEDDNY